MVWSRDALMHIHDKPRLFTRLLDLLAPGGNLVVTDYARGTGPGSPEFQAYVKSTGYHLVDPASYGKLLEGAGFVDVEVEDATDKFIDIMKREAGRLADEPRRLRRHVLRGRPEVPDRPLGDEGRVLPRRRHEVGHLQGAGGPALSRCRPGRGAVADRPTDGGPCSCRHRPRSGTPATSPGSATGSGSTGRSAGSRRSPRGSRTCRS